MPYFIYRVFFENGKSYIGLSKKPRVRVADHLRRAKRGQHENHPFYSAIRKYGAESVRWEILFECEDLENAKSAEVAGIALLETRDRRYGYNLSKGGDYDCMVGPKTFWDRVRNDPEYGDRYLTSLRAAMRARAESGGYARPDPLIEADRTRRAALSPRERWKEQWRRIRLAKRATMKDGSLKGGWRKTSDTNAGRATQASIRSLKSKRAAKKQWASRTEEERKNVGRKISAGVSKFYQDHPEARDEFFERLKSTRGKINRSVQGPAASKGLKQFWIDLKADPERYAAHIAKRRETLLTTLREKGYAIKNDL